MVGWHYSKQCGVNTVTYTGYPVYNVIGDARKCPSHGDEGQILGNGIAFGKVCRKCGLIQYINGVPALAVKMAKHNGYKCTECNHPLADEPRDNYYSCVRCGRAYSSYYMKKHAPTSGTPKKCPHCGGNTLFI